ncbi:MAG TPA: hypothetical protein ACFYD6_03235 [Candidatus Brocadiia bacterium]|nr:hypothetical protein [Candidatus Brocadiales bacterium]
MLIPIETWTILSVDDENGVMSHVVGAYCPACLSACIAQAGRCEYFHHADSKGIECIYNEVETDVIDGQTLE